MTESLKAQLQTIVPLDDEEVDAMAARFVARRVKRHQFLLRAGEVCREVLFVKKGCLRYYYVSEEGEERTGQFFFENGWYTDYDSFLTARPSTQFIQTLEPSELLVLSKERLYELYDSNPKIERFGRLMAERAYLGANQRNASFLNQSPEERYLTLIATRSKLVERVPLHYIASYLGIQPESLSRIRKRLYDGRANS